VYSQGGIAVVKNITLSIPEDVASEMDSMPEVNWSSVARTSIVHYIEMRKNPDITGLIEKLRAQKSQEYMLGRKKAEEILDQQGYRILNVILRKYWKAIEGIEEMDTVGYEPEPWVVMPTREDELQKILAEMGLVEKDLSMDFLRGLKERILEIDNSLHDE
jgi:hypothetical protein